MEQDGTIERSTSEWAFPVLLVKDGLLQMCVDYRCLDTIAEADAYPMPCVDDLIDSLRRVKCIATLDLACSYWQVPVEEASRNLTAVVTPVGFFQFQVVPFGLYRDTTTFQQMMDHLLVECTDYAAAYLDDAQYQLE